MAFGPRTPAKVGSASSLPSVSVLSLVFLCNLKACLFHEQFFIDFFFFPLTFPPSKLVLLPQDSCFWPKWFISLRILNFGTVVYIPMTQRNSEGNSSGFWFRLYLSFKGLLRLHLSVKVGRKIKWRVWFKIMSFLRLFKHFLIEKLSRKWKQILKFRIFHIAFYSEFSSFFFF